MAKLVFGLQQSLDGYVDHLEMGPPGSALSRHFMEHVRNQVGRVALVEVSRPQRHTCRG
jgi:hypothetical protein